MCRCWKDTASFTPLTVEDNLLIGTYARAPARRPDEACRAMYDAVPGDWPNVAGSRRPACPAASSRSWPWRRALSRRTALLILDEPSGGLAPLVIDRILDVARALPADGVAMLLVEQLVEKALAHADRCYLMATGRVVHEGPAKDLAGSEILHSAYLGQV